MSERKGLRKWRKRKLKDRLPESVDNKNTGNISDEPVAVPKGKDTGENFEGEPSFGTSVKNRVRRVGGTITHAVRVPVEKVAKGLGISNGIAGLLLALLVGTVGGTGGMMFYNYQYEQRMMQQEIVLDDCKTDVEEAGKSAGYFEGDVDAMQMETANKMWGVLKALGCNDNQAAGALGCWEAESGIDPTAVEHIYDEPYSVEGMKKQAALADLGAYTMTLSAAQSNPTGYASQKYGHACGLGLAQFTGPAVDDLMDYAAGMDMDWWELDVNVCFAIAPVSQGGFGGGAGGADWLRTWIENPTGASSPEEAAGTFCEKYEGYTGDLGPRPANARKWYEIFAGTMGDEEYGQSILEMANTTRAGSASKAAKDASEECAEAEEEEPDNGDLARAAVAYAYENKDLGRGNNGTELYQAVHEAVYPGDPYYMSCDRGVACAVRWSDADDNFPAGACPNLISYCQSHTDKWEFIGNGANVQGSGKLEAGDVCVCYGHVVIYVSNEIVQEKFPGSSYDFVSASLNERSPGCGNESLGADYYVFRLRNYDNPGQYKDCVAGRNLRDR